MEDSPLSKLSQATIETIETPPETERSSLEADKLFLSQARPHEPPEVTRLQRLHNMQYAMQTPEMTQSLHSQVSRGNIMQSMQGIKGVRENMQYGMPPPEMTQSLHSQVSRENNMQSMQNIPGVGESLQYGVPGLHQSSADQLSHLQMLQRLSMQPSYQFIEDYENISPRLIHNANLMHHLNTLHRTSLLGKILRNNPFINAFPVKSIYFQSHQFQHRV